MSRHPGVRGGPFEIRPAEDLTALIAESSKRRSTATNSREMETIEKNHE